MTVKDKVSPEEKAKEYVRNRQRRIKKNKPNQDGTSSLLKYLREQRKEKKAL